MSASRALAEDRVRAGVTDASLADDFTLQIAYLRDDPNVLPIVLFGMGLYSPDEQRRVWFEADPARAPGVVRGEVAAAEAALRGLLESSRETLRHSPNADLSSLRRPFDVGRVRADRSLREVVLKGLGLHRRKLQVRDEDRTIWIIWRDGDPPTPFRP